MPPVPAPVSAADRARSRSRRVVERRCVACRGIFARERLWRVARNADGLIAFDPDGRREGRGAYFCRSADCVAAVATEPTLLGRALRAAPQQSVLDQIMLLTDPPTAHSSSPDCKELT